ncbi:MAG: hypothetical protein R3E53_08605 [Myxococcota bacterium]
MDLAIEGDAAALARAIAVPGEGGPSFTAHDRFGTVRLETSEAVSTSPGSARSITARPGALPEVEPGISRRTPVGATSRSTRSISRSTPRRRPVRST